MASNNSWGGGGYSQALYDAIAASDAAGVLFVAAAGNSADNNRHAALPRRLRPAGIVAVAATDRSDAQASFSNYGATTWTCGPGRGYLSTTAPDKRTTPTAARRWPRPT